MWLDECISRVANSVRGLIPIIQYKICRKKPVLQNNISKSLIKPMTSNRFCRYKRINIWTEWKSNRMGCHRIVPKSTFKSSKRCSQLKSRSRLDLRLLLSNQRTHFSCLLMMNHLCPQKMKGAEWFLLTCQNPSSCNS